MKPRGFELILVFMLAGPAVAQYESLKIRGALSISLEDGGRVGPQSYGNVNAKTESKWTLRLGGAPANTEFAFCWVKNDRIFPCQSNFGKTDLYGNWTQTGVFSPSLEGHWIEWIEFPSGATSNRISFTVGTTADEGSLSLDGGSTPWGFLRTSESAVFHIGEKRSLLLLTSRPHYNEFVDLCYERLGVFVTCIPKVGRVDGNYSWKRDDPFTSADVGGWTVWIRYANGRRTNSVTYTVDDENVDSQVCDSGTVYPAGPRAGYHIFRRFDTDWYSKDSGEYTPMLGHSGGYGGTLEFTGCAGGNYLWMQWAYNRFMSLAFRAPWGGQTDRGLRIGDPLERFQSLYPGAHKTPTISNGPSNAWSSDLEVWDVGPLRVAFRSGVVEMIQVDWWKTDGPGIDQASSTRSEIGPKDASFAWR